MITLANSWVNLLHVLVIVPLLLYVSVTSYRGKPVPRWLWIVIGLLAIGALGYHGYRLYQKAGA